MAVVVVYLKIGPFGKCSVSTLGRAGANEERSSTAMPRLKTARGDLMKGSSGSSIKAEALPFTTAFVAKRN